MQNKPTLNRIVTCVQCVRQCIERADPNVPMAAHCARHILNRFPPAPGPSKSWAPTQFSPTID